MHAHIDIRSRHDSAGADGGQLVEHACGVVFGEDGRSHGLQIHGQLLHLPAAHAVIRCGHLGFAQIAAVSPAFAPLGILEHVPGDGLQAVSVRLEAAAVGEPLIPDPLHHVPIHRRQQEVQVHPLARAVRLLVVPLDHIQVPELRQPCPDAMPPQAADEVRGVLSSLLQRWRIPPVCQRDRQVALHEVAVRQSDELLFRVLAVQPPLRLPRRVPLRRAHLASGDPYGVDLHLHLLPAGDGLGAVPGHPVVPQVLKGVLADGLLLFKQKSVLLCAVSHVHPPAFDWRGGACRPSLDPPLSSSGRRPAAWRDL